MAPTMSVTFLGTGSAYPTPKKGSSSLVLRYDGQLWMFDCGEGTQIQLMKSDLKPGKISKIFITHLHGDHLYGLPGLLCTISQTNQRQCPLEVYGPLGVAKFLRVTLGLSQSDLGFQFRVMEMVPSVDMYTYGPNGIADIDHSDAKQLHPNEVPGRCIEATIVDGTPVWDLLDEDTIRVSAGALMHRVPSFGFVITERDLPGSVDISKLKSYGLQPGPVVGRILGGEEVTGPNGFRVRAEDIVKPKTPGRKVVICGDSWDSSKLSPLARDADVYIHEATLQNDMEQQAIDKGHSTPAMAAKFALQANAKHLYLTHFSQRYTESSRATTDFSVTDLWKEAKEVFGPNVSAAEDFYTYEIKTQKT